MLSPLINTAKQDTVHLDAIRLDGGTQPRGGINDDYVTELVEALQAGVTLPPVDIMYDGEIYWLFDGFHRVAAHRKADFYLVPANIHQGTQADAQWRSYAANQTHGLRRSNEDKQRAIKAALRHPNGAQMPNREIARHLGVDEKTVRLWREKLESSAEIPQTTERTVTRDGVQYTQNTANIGANQPPRRHIYENELERIVVAWAAEHYPGDWPENPSHTNGAYWQQLTAHLRAAITAATWHESDLKTIIKRLHAQRRQSPISNPSPYKSLAQMDADGEIPPLGPPSPSSAYSPVHPIQNTLRPLTATYTAADLRTTANYRGGSRWFEARRLLQAAELHYRDRDLVQALNNLADELEQRDRTQPAQPSTISNQQSPISNPEAVDDSALFDYEIDDALTELVRHANATLDGQIQSVFPGSAKYWAEQVSQTLQHPVTYQRMTLAMERLMRSLQEERAEQPGFVPIKMADDRIPRCRRLIGIYNQAISVEDEYGALTGCYSETTAPKRELQKLIARLQHTVDLLEGKTTAAAEECD